MAKDKCKDAKQAIRTLFKDVLDADGNPIPVEGMSSEDVIAKLRQMHGHNEYSQRIHKLTFLAENRVKLYMESVPEHLRTKAFMDMISGGGIRQKTEIFEALTKNKQEELMTFMVPLERQIDYYNAIGHRIMAEASEDFRVKTRDVGKEVLGFSRDKSGQADMIRAIYTGELSGNDVALQYAKTWKEVIDLYRKLYNKYGGNMAHLEDYRVAQYHNPVRIRKAGYEQWRADVEQTIDMERLVYSEEGPIKLSEDKKNALLKGIYDNIVTEGATSFRIKDFSPHAYSPLYRRHLQHRVMHFPDAEKWLSYADKYGAPDYYQGMMSHVEMMSREIAAMRMFGPDPDAGIEKIQKGLQQQLGSRSAGALAAGTYEQMMGRQHAVNVNVRDAMGMLRNLSLIPKIGQAVISAISDIAFLTKTLHFNGIPVVKSLGRFVRNLDPTYADDRMILSRIGLLSDYAVNSSRTANRFSEVSGYGWSAKGADFIVRASGLNHWTYSVKNTFGLEFSSNLAELTKKGWGDIPKKVRRAMTRYGINEQDWATAMGSKKYRKNGVDFLDMSDISKVNTDTAAKFTGMIREETFFAAPEPGAKARAISTLGSRPGTVAGELIKFSTQLKSFPISIMTSHIMRAADQGVKGGISYAGSLFLGTTILGGLALQSKAMLAGKTPEDWDSPSFIASAMAQGGGLGIMADFIFRDHSRVSSFADFMGGPVYGDVSAIAALLLGSPEELDEFSENVGARYGARAKKVFDRLIPELWYTRVITQRWIKDNMGKLLDPNWTTKQERMRKKMKEKGQTEWWKSGESLPDF